MNQPKDQSCANCRYFVSECFVRDRICDRKDEDTEFGHCHRRAPNGSWPLVESIQWCGEWESAAKRQQDAADSDLLDKPVAHIGLNRRARNCLGFYPRDSEKIRTVGELRGKTEGELLGMAWLGPITLGHIKQRLEEHGLHLAER